MTDFATIIDNAITSDMRTRLAEFLSGFEPAEFGRPRVLNSEQRALVLTCVDHFLLNDSFTDLGSTEFKQLRKRLNKIAHYEGPLRDDMIGLVRNACFDALACISALEARLCRCLDRAEVRTMLWSAPLMAAANDP